jgi:hypothetical protein
MEWWKQPLENVELRGRVPHTGTDGNGVFGQTECIQDTSVGCITVYMVVHNDVMEIVDTYASEALSRMRPR